MSLFVGLISGTSMDGVDATLVDISDSDLAAISSLTMPYTDTLRNELLNAIDPRYSGTLHDLATLDIEVGRAFATAAQQLLENARINSDAVSAIGSHGQTLRHSPATNPAYSLQIGNGPTIAAITKIDTVCDFRGIDIACGGQGAPLVPAFHKWLFGDGIETKVILNIGGIANITVLSADPAIPFTGFDTGPGNCLMDEWCSKHLGIAFDHNGDWAKNGVVSELLLEFLANEPYFTDTIPKSTGREYFNLQWLEKNLSNAACNELSPADVQATLLALSITTISAQIEQHATGSSEVLVCGGGAFNQALMQGLQRAMSDKKVTSTSEYGVDPAMIEAAAFAWFAHCRVNQISVALTTQQTPQQLILGAHHIAPT